MTVEMDDFDHPRKDIWITYSKTENYGCRLEYLDEIRPISKNVDIYSKVIQDGIKRLGRTC